MDVLVVAPHPDDETLGCGGTLLRHHARGDRVSWLIMTCMDKSVGYTEDQIRERREEIYNVAYSYGMVNVFPLKFPTTTLDTISQRELLESVAGVINQVKPEVIYLPNRSDIHSDHRVTFDVIMASIKTFRISSILKVLMYEVLSETEFTPSLQSNAFVPNSFSDISDVLEKKIEIMKLYRNQLGIHPFPRSEENMRALAIFRGAIARVKYAEAFMVIKEILQI